MFQTEITLIIMFIIVVFFIGYLIGYHKGLTENNKDKGDV